MRICAVVPAAGRGSRLGLDRPKIFAPISDTDTIWSVMRRKLLAVADHINLVASPESEPAFRAVLRDDLELGLVSISIQSTPIGMGDAIFQGFPVWSKAHIALIIWGDQVFVSPETLAQSLALHGMAPNTVILPVAALPAPYVEYVFTPDGNLSSVRQSREGDQCSSGGYNDVGTFIVSVSGLAPLWREYLAQMDKGSITGEVNFLPFLPFLVRHGWQVRRCEIADAREARGVNVPDDLAFFRQIFSK
jgi:bifunctional UDP-N-acetylglucosamine pyrophosphorylase/glucosamine-1-phosphate N-acetyltransferase